LLTLHYDNGERKYELQQTIAPGDQMWLNLADLIHRRVADHKGRMLPADLASGTYDLRDLNPGKGGNLVGSELALDTTLGQQARPNILRCCGVDQPYFVPDIDEILFLQNSPLDVQALDCTGTPVELSFDFNNWWSGDNSVAQVTYKNAYGAGPGLTTGYASGEVEVGNAGYCTLEPVQVQVPIVVCPSSFSITATTQESLSKVFPADKTGLGATATITVAPTTSNWNGTTVYESLSTTSNSCPSGFGNLCAVTGSGQFTVGAGPFETVDGQILPPTQNVFYDEHVVYSGTSLLNYYNVNSCQAVCQQTYSCVQRSMGTDTITYSFTKGTISGTLSLWSTQGSNENRRWQSLEHLGSRGSSAWPSA